MPAKKPRRDEKLQIERFKETAREIETDDSKERFEAAFENVVKVKSVNSVATENDC